MPWTSVSPHFIIHNELSSFTIHSYSAIVGATGKDGKSIYEGKRSTGFSNIEEEQAGKTKAIPFLLENRVSDLFLTASVLTTPYQISELGGKYEKASEPWGAHVTTDGTLILGQNPASAKGVGEAILKALE